MTDFKKLIMTGGGTAGHVMPNLALLPFLKNQFEIHYIGSNGGMEERLAKSAGLIFHATECVKFSRKLSPASFAVPFKLMKAKAKAAKLIKEIGPAAIMSKGGYVALPVVLAAPKDVPIFIHESDLSFGLANKLSIKKAHTVFTSFPETAEKLDKAVCCGSPIRTDIYLGKADSARAECGLYSPLPYLVITGGSSGAEALNKCVAEAAHILTQSFNVIHITGANWDKKLSLPNYFQLKFTDRISDYFALADYVVTRGGSNALFELMALKKPALCVPLPKGGSRGDQVLNAERFAGQGCLNVLYQENLRPESLITELNRLRRDATRLKTGMDALKNIDGTRKIASMIIETVKNKAYK